MERLYRDNRLNPIHEGSHGIHGLDLLGRKVNLAGGVTLAIFEEEMQPALDAASGNEALAEMGESLTDIWQLAKRRRDRESGADTVDAPFQCHAIFGRLWACGHRVVVAASGVDCSGGAAKGRAGGHRFL